MTIEIVKPTTVSIPDLNMELQFYISSDGKKAGMSQSALARLCGVNDRALFADGRLITKLSQENGETKQLPKCLQPFVGKVFEERLKGDAGNSTFANIINSKAAAAIIEYYAFDSKAANETARKSLRAFLSIGIETWIKTVTGYMGDTANEKRFDRLEGMIGELIGEVKQLSEKVEDFGRVVKVYPAIESMTTSMKALPLGIANEFTLNEFLEAFNLKITTTKKRKFRLAVSQAYLSLKNEAPKKAWSKEANRIVNFYNRSDIPLIKEALEAVN